MIRDPSDGSVKGITPKANEINAVAPKNRSEGIDTGLRQPIRTDAQERLERSREWLKSYYARKDASHGRGNAPSADAAAEGGLRDDNRWSDRQADRAENGDLASDR